MNLTEHKKFMVATKISLVVGLCFTFLVVASLMGRAYSTDTGANQTFDETFVD